MDRISLDNNTDLWNRIIKVCICTLNSSHVRKICSFILIVIMAILFILNSLSVNPIYDRHDSWNYYTNGLSMIKEGKTLFAYPGSLFSLTVVSICEFLLGSSQPSAQIIVSCFGVVLVTIALYFLLRFKLNGLASFIFFLPLFFILPYKSIQVLLLRPLSDVWLLLFLVLAMIANLKNRPIYSGVLIGFGFLYRSQAFQLGAIMPLFGGKGKIKRLFLTISSAIILVFIVNLIIRNFVSMTGLGEIEYYKRAFIDNMNAANLKIAIDATINLLLAKELYILYITIALNFTAYFSAKGFAARSVSLYSLSITVVSIAGLFIMMVSTAGQGADTRYFLYSMIFSYVGAYLFLYEIVQRFILRLLINRSTRQIMVFSVFYKTVCAVFIVLIPAFSLINGYDSRAIEANIQKFDFDLSISPNVDDSLPVASEMYPYFQPYRIFGFKDIRPLPTIEEFFRDGIDADCRYIFFSEAITRPNEWMESGILNEDSIIDGKGKKYRKVWLSSIGSVSYALFELQ